jgi:hypothetical protein
MGATMHPTDQRYRLLILFSLMLVLFTGCAAAPTYAEVQATAQVAGCWPDLYPTPRAVTVTPAGAPTAAPLSTVLPGTAMATALPTTTPYPRCPPRPGETQAPWPTPVPPPPPYPSMEPRRWVGGSAEQTTLHLPGSVYALDLAVHPSEGWPVVGVIQRSWGTPIHAYVRVYNPQTQQWGVAQQIDTGESSIGMDRFGSLAVGVIGDRTVFAAWGASDRVLNDDGSWRTTPDLWASASTDYGATWTLPQRLATNCWNVLDMATNDEGYAVVLANCFTQTGDTYIGSATTIVKRPGQDWLPAQKLAAPGWSGSIVLAGSGPEAKAVALTSALLAPQSRQLTILTKRLVDENQWFIQSRAFDLPRDEALDDPTGGAGWHFRGLVFPHVLPDRSVQNGVIFTWATHTRAGLYALTSLDGGQTWGNAETIEYRPGEPDRIGHQDFIAPAYDPIADRLAAIWTCCGETQRTSADNTHYASWSVPGSGSWHALPDPLILGSIQAHDTAAAQALNSRMTWVAWIENGNQIVVRSLELNALIPIEHYPTPTPASTPTLGGGS